MSYILDALDKAERERKRGQIPSLQTNERAATTHHPRSPWVWVAVFAVIFNALLAGILIYSSTHETQVASIASPVVETLPPAPTPAPLPSPIEVPIHRATPPATTPSVLLMTDQELQEQARQLEMESTPTPSPEPSPVEPEPTLATPAGAGREHAVTPLEMIPLLVEMPQQLQQALPPIRVDVHVHASKAENRFVMINLRRYREGDEVAPDLILERITKEGMVLKFRGEQFRYLMKM